MEHLDTEKIVRFVTINKIDRDSLDLMSQVNGHIRTCEACRQKVDAFQKISDMLKLESLQKEAEKENQKEIKKEIYL